MAESEGFEPPDPFGSTVFKTAAFDHSASSPDYCSNFNIIEYLDSIMKWRHPPLCHIHPCMRPLRGQRCALSKIAPGDFVDHSASSPECVCAARKKPGLAYYKHLRLGVISLSGQIKLEKSRLSPILSALTAALVPRLTLPGMT